MKDLKKNFYFLFKRPFPTFFAVLLILIGGLIVRLISASQYNLMFGYDEVTDLILVRRIAIGHDLIAIGKAIYGNPNLRHGVGSYYLMAPAMLFSQSPVWVAIWNGLFSLAAAVVVYLTTKSVFKNQQMSLIAASLFAASNVVVGFSGWVSHPTFAPLFVGLFYFGLWQMFEEKKRGFVLSFASLGLAIQSDLMFIYLIPILFIFLAVYRPKFPGLKALAVSAVSFLIIISTFIYSELQFNFSSLKTILGFSKSLDASKIPAGERIFAFLKNLFDVLANNIIPQDSRLGVSIGILVILIIFYQFIKANKDNRYRISFLIFYIFSPAVMLLVGFHNKPWSLLGTFPAVSMAIAFAVSKIKNQPILIAVVGLVLILNFKAILAAREAGKFFVSVPRSSILASQIKVIDYTYESSAGRPFAIDAVNYPLYVNSYWSYDYPWYGLGKYGSLPTWAGSDQIYPYDTLAVSNGEEEYLYLIIDDTTDIPSWAKQASKNHWDGRSIVVDEKTIDGFVVQKRRLTS